MTAYFIVDGIPQNGGAQQHGHTQRVAEMPGPGHGPGCEKQGIPGQKGRHHQARLAKDDQKKERIKPCAVFGHQRKKVLINMQDKRNALLQQRDFIHRSYP